MLSCKEDILELASRPEDYDKSFVLTDDIDMEGAAFDGAIVAPNSGMPEDMFKGHFNGNGHMIENFSIIGGKLIGFFGGIGPKGMVTHLGLTNVRVNGQSESYVGVLAGSSMGNIMGCYAQGSVAGHRYVGGLVGHQSDGYIADCFSQGDVEGTSDCVGGLVGLTWRGTIHRCYAAVRVSSQNPLGCGGLVGRSTGPSRGSQLVEVLDSFWDVDVSGIAAGTHGLGLPTEEMQDVSIFLDAKWDFVGEPNNGINDIWMQADRGGYPVLASFSGTTPVMLPGGGSEDSPYVVSTARELAAMIYYRDYFHFDIGADIDLTGIKWSGPVLSSLHGVLEGHGHCIRGFRQEGGCGLFDAVAYDATVTNLHLEDCEVKATDGRVGCLAGRNYGRIADCSVAGIVLGGTVTGGLIGYNKGTISGCSVSTAIVGLGTAGGLTGENAGPLINNVSRGAVSGGSNVGGLTGSNSGSVESCSSTAAVIGYGNLGGLIGSNDGSVADCYARGVLAGAYCIGGLVGLNYNSVSRCYSAGAITGLNDVGGLIGRAVPPEANASSSFWDMESSGIQESAGGAGMSRAQMQDSQTFLSAGWDFVGETVNGTADVWVMPDNSYPELRGEKR